MIKGKFSEEAAQTFAKDFELLSEENLYLKSMKHTKRLGRTYADTLFLYDQVDQFVHEMLPMRQNLDPEFISPSRIKKPQAKKGKKQKVEEVACTKADDRAMVEQTFKNLMKHNSLQQKCGD